MLETDPLAGESTLNTSKTNCDAVDMKQSVQTPLEDMADFRHVANEATRGLVASEEKNREPAMCAGPYSTWRCTCLVILMVCFVAATPLSLVLTVPAYILADRGEILSEQGFKKQSHQNLVISVILNIVASALAVTFLSVAMFLYIHLASRS